MTGAKKPVLVIEYPKTAERQMLLKKLAKENGCVWLVTDRQLKTLGESGIFAAPQRSQGGVGRVLHGGGTSNGSLKYSKIAFVRP